MWCVVNGGASGPRAKSMATATAKAKGAGEALSSPYALLNPKGLESAKVFLLLLVEAVSRNHEIMI